MVVLCLAGVPHNVMTEKLKHILVERIEQLTRLNVSLEQERTKANEKADRYYGWWQEDETKLAELEARIKELEVNAAGLLRDAEAWREHLAAMPGYNPNPVDE